MSKPDKKLHFHCECGSALEAVWKAKRPFGKKEWVADKCPRGCAAKDLTNVSIVTCPHCDYFVVKGEKFCPVCMQPVDISTESVPIKCPNKDCGVTIYLPKNYKGEYTCRYCEQRIREAKIRELLKETWIGQNEQAKLIELPSAANMTAEKMVVYQVSGTSFPRKSRVQVSEGTWGLLMHNGVSQYPLGYGTHELENSGLSLTAKLDAASEGDEEIFNTTIFCVTRKLPEIQHEITSTTIAAKPVGKAPAREYDVTASSIALRCTVDDPKAFMSLIGFQAMKEDVLLQENGCLKTRTRVVLSAAFDEAARTAFELWDASKSDDAYKTEILRLLTAKLPSALREIGLCLADISLQSISVEETRVSKERQADYLKRVEAIETVKLPDVQEMQQKKLVIYKHDRDEFEYQSRVQVSEGTYGLMFKNGACQDVLLPGSYLLMDRNLDRGSQYDAAMQGENITFTTSLYSVLKTLPAFEWFGMANFIDMDHEGSAPAREYMVQAQGTIRFQVDDARAFAGVVGFRQLSVAELIHAKRGKGQLPMLNRELEGSYPGESESGWLYEKIVSIMNAILSDTCKVVFGSRLDVRRMDMYRFHFTKRLQEKFSEQLNDTGLSVVDMNLSTLSAEETGESEIKQKEYEEEERARESVLAAAQSRIIWDARDIRLHVKNEIAMNAMASFTGDYRLQVDNKALFLRLPEVIKALESGMPESIAATLKSKLEDMIRNKITIIGQQFIDDGIIADLENAIAYTNLTNHVRSELDRELAGDGLCMQQFSMYSPAIVASKELKDYKSIGVKKQKIKAYAESELQLRTAPIRVHMKDDSTVYVKAIFFGKAHLRVADESVFFATSEVQQFLTSDPFVSATTVTDYYTDRLNSNFADITSRVVQAIIDQTNADIQELNRLSGLLQSNLLNNLNARANSFGMRLDSLDIGDPSVTERSENMLTWVKRNETKSGNALEREIQKLNNDKVIFEYSEDGRIKISKNDTDIDIMESDDSVAAKKAELRKREADRKFNEEMDKIRKQGELERLMDEVVSGKEDRDFERLQKEFQREHELREAAINQAIREAQIQQQGDIDAKAREQKAEFERMINAAENRQIIDGLMRKIAESNLEWQKKLDEYARLKRRISVEDQVDLEELIEQGKAKQKEIDAMSDLRIQREANEVFILVGSAKIKLDTAEAELLEKIARYSEDRDKRIEDAAADRAERKATLEFEQRMRDRQEQVAQDMEKLKLQYEHELALRDRDDKLAAMQYEQNKLVHILEHLKHEISSRADVDKARFDAEKEIEKAKAQYEAQHEQSQQEAAEKRWQEQLKYEEAAAQRAENYQKMMAQLQLDLEKIRHETQRNQNDNAAKVGVAQAENISAEEVADIKRIIEQMADRMEKRFRELTKEMDKIRNAYKDQKRKGQDMSNGKMSPVPPFASAPGPIPQNPYAQPPYTPAGGSFGYYKTMDDISVTGGLGVNAGNSPLNSPIYSVGHQPGMSPTCICPACKRVCSSQASMCEHCGNPI